MSTSLSSSHSANDNNNNNKDDEFWQAAFVDKQDMWGLEPCQSALFAADYFVKQFAAESGSKDDENENDCRKKILIPGIGYGRNAKPFMEHDMSVTGIEISKTAIDMCRSKLGLSETQLPIYHGSVTNMPYDDDELYDGIFCYGLVYLLDGADARRKLLDDCYRQLRPGGYMIFSVICKTAPFYGQGTKLADDFYERMPGLKMYFYDAASVEREFGPYGLVEQHELDEPNHGGASSFPFINVVCHKKL